MIIYHSLSPGIHRQVVPPVGTSSFVQASKGVLEIRMDGTSLMLTRINTAE